jgi:hypothetical protein
MWTYDTSSNAVTALFHSLAKNVHIELVMTVNTSFVMRCENGGYARLLAVHLLMTRMTCRGVERVRRSEDCRRYSSATAHGEPGVATTDSRRSG